MIRIKPITLQAAYPYRDLGWWIDMNLRSKRRELQGLNGAVGLVAGLGGYVGNLYSYGLATFLMLAIWIVGATLINLLTDPPSRG